jgi:hypothetical protein
MPHKQNQLFCDFFSVICRKKIFIVLVHSNLHYFLEPNPVHHEKT